MNNYCGYCDNIIPKHENIVELLDSDYKILCRKHKTEIDKKGYITHKGNNPNADPRRLKLAANILEQIFKEHWKVDVKFDSKKNEVNCKIILLRDVLRL